MSLPVITDQEFGQFQRFIFDAAGITLSASKKALVSGRLAKRLAHYQLDSYGAYYQLLGNRQKPEEVQLAIDLLTTNETYFFREPAHFDFLRARALAAVGRGQPFRVWSAASSTGEEAYSMAMVLADSLASTPWEVFGSDISSSVLHGARSGHYSMQRTDHIPPVYLTRYCLKGGGNHAGTLLIDRAIRNKVRFAQVNLNDQLPEMGLFDVIFLRNVMIYFSDDTKRDVVARVLSKLRPGGHFCIGHSESLNDITSAVETLSPSIYRKP
ncbi:protein-glutamate O-methyltransferase CheR [Actimicrobium sp. CCI2.3]|uniref:CheR family methyltransferase n=1 Tax=Actimicrobium sp. CCI2.3 TaxID=3048616 RepID=UPI002AB3A126|nr:protein-glutamate O-methyltransferase CheR [Actimicrobium sp. CCI2.3]MDY7572745.1 protein-glutamate O-methyltransferase CheR [Actimicrobium sp. CCI2.3]MEB0022265.1 protein-glutamate O-methyltransferase CheR [Actimicrobium sp. CCI2.3]